MDQVAKATLERVMLTWKLMGPSRHVHSERRGEVSKIQMKKYLWALTMMLTRVKKWPVCSSLLDVTG